MKDDEILALLRKRRQEGLSAILEKYAGLMGYIIRNTGNESPEDISECMSDALFKIWKRIRQYDPSKSSFKTWMLLVTRGCAIDYFRKNKRHRGLVSLNNMDEVSVTDTHLETLSDHTVLSYLQALDPPDNEIFYRRFVLGESAETIAALLDITVGGVYKRLSRGKEKLKVLMDKEGYRL